MSIQNVTHGLAGHFIAEIVQSLSSGRHMDDVRNVVDNLEKAMDLVYSGKDVGLYAIREGIMKRSGHERIKFCSLRETEEECSRFFKENYPHLLETLCDQILDLAQKDMLLHDPYHTGKLLGQFSTIATHLYRRHIALDNLFSWTRNAGAHQFISLRIVGNEMTARKVLENDFHIIADNFYPFG